MENMRNKIDDLIKESLQTEVEPSLLLNHQLKEALYEKEEKYYRMSLYWVPFGISFCSTLSMVLPILVTRTLTIFELMMVLCNIVGTFSILILTIIGCIKFNLKEACLE